jgi:cytochrome c oxidase cbb3-type subunit 3
MHRVPACLLLLATAIMTGEAYGQAATANQANIPSPQQLLSVPVGGTHVPAAAQLPQVANPFEGNPQAIAQGRQLFTVMHCIECHASGGGGGMGPPLSDKDWIYGGEPGNIYLSIVQGRPNGMPSFAQALPPDAIWKLVSYVRTLSQTRAEPAAATPKQTGKP